MSKFDRWWYENGSGFVTPGGDEEDCARAAWDDAILAAVEAVEGLNMDWSEQAQAIRAIQRLKDGK